MIEQNELLKEYKDMMNMNYNDFEVMAPVGSRESLAAAIQAGADSVYFGIGQLNMRSHSANKFGIDDLRDIARECDANGIKTYLTVNTIIYDEDIEDDAPDSGCGARGGHHGGDSERCGCYDLLSQHRTGGASFHTTEHFER